jgi:VanZ family protein
LFLSWIKHIIKWLPTILVMGSIFYFSSIPAEEVHHVSQPGIQRANRVINQMGGPTPRDNDFDWLKVGHVIGYALLGLSVHYALRSYPLVEHAQIKTIGICFLYAMTDEFHQRFVVGRTPRMTDVLLDTLAVIIIVCILEVISQRKSPI